MKKPWSQMTDDEKLVAVFRLGLPFIVLFVVQLICVLVLTFALGTTTPADIPVGSSRQWLNFAPALGGVPLAALFFAWKPLRKPGQWIWVPGALHFFYGTFYRGISQAQNSFYQMFSGGDPILTVMSILATAPIFYSLTMFAMNQWAKRSVPQGKSVSSET